jgi:hypothetical protein
VTGSGFAERSGFARMRSRMFGKNLNPALNAVVGGWNLSPIFSYHGGFPLTIAGNDFSGTNSFGSRANCSGPPSYVKEFQSGAGLQWFSDAPYSNPVINTFGDCGVSTVRGPGLNRWDLSVQRMRLRGPGRCNAVSFGFGRPQRSVSTRWRFSDRFSVLADSPLQQEAPVAGASYRAVR